MCQYATVVFYVLKYVYLSTHNQPVNKNEATVDASNWIKDESLFQAVCIKTVRLELNIGPNRGEFNFICYKLLILAIKVRNCDADKRRS